MNIKLNVVYVSGFLALTSFLVQAAKADEWNKRTEFQFSAPVQIPGKVLPAGKYVFELLDSQSDRNIVQVFSEDADGNQSLVATVMAIPDYMTETPDKTIVHFEERNAGSPEAIHNWFYPGDNSGWQFVYSKEQTQEANNNPGANSNTMPVPAPVATAPAPVAAAPAPSVPPTPPALRNRKTQPSVALAVVEEDALVAESDAPPPPPAQGTDTPSTTDQTLPQTGGYSDLQLIAGLVMLGAGLASVLASRRASLA